MKKKKEIAMQLEHLTFEVSDEIATITLNRPEARNAFSTEMRQSLATALENIRDRTGSDIKALIITARGALFVPGAILRG